MTANEFELLKKYSPLLDGPILEVGSYHYSSCPSPRSVFDPSISYLGIDLEEGPNVDMIHDMEYPLNQKFKSIICTSCLEHCQRPWRMAKNIEDSLEKGGRLFVAAPFVWRFHNYPSDYWRYSTEAFKVLFPSIEWVALKYATKKKKEVADSYHELMQKYKPKMKDHHALICVSIGFGVKK